jgi:hypothetical protein
MMQDIIWTVPIFGTREWRNRRYYENYWFVILKKWVKTKHKKLKENLVFISALDALCREKLLEDKY